MDPTGKILTKQNMKETIVTVLIVMFFGSLTGAILVASINSSEISECEKWQEYSAQYEGFYLVQWQKDQCDSHEISINAPVK